MPSLRGLEMKDERMNIICIASEFKGGEFLEECQKAGWHVTLVTRDRAILACAESGLVSTLAC